MSVKRRDNKNRILRTGESQRKDGRYAFKYTDGNGVVHFAYSWKLEKTDRLPANKRDCLSLRELEKNIMVSLDKGIRPNADNLTVLQLVKKYTTQKKGVKFHTQRKYNTVINRLKSDTFGQKLIVRIKSSDAKEWCVKLQKGGLSYGSVYAIKTVLRPAFQMAVDDDLLLKNPFNFSLSTLLEDDRHERAALTEEEEKSFLDFIRDDATYSKYYNAIYILFNTGVRISEFCGLTISDIDMEKRLISINHQLIYKGKEGFFIETLKSKSAKRLLPMTDGVYQCFSSILSDKEIYTNNYEVGGLTGFLFLTVNGEPTHTNVWSKRLTNMRNRHNELRKIELPTISPHICRHTYCTHMVNKGIKPKVLQYLMGHANIRITMDVYTHMSYMKAIEEVNRISATESESIIESEFITESEFIGVDSTDTPTEQTNLMDEESILIQEVNDEMRRIDNIR